MFKKISLSVLILAASLPGASVSDNFNDNYLDPFLWTAVVFGPGPGSVAETGQHLVISMGAQTGAAVVLNFTVGGDFDAQVDYSILNWPSSAPPLLGAEMSFDPGGVAYGVTRTFNAYLADEFPPCCTGVPTTDTSGSLRLTRSGTTFSAYYWGSGAWQLIDSTSAGNVTKDSIIGLGLYGNGTPASVAFDNFSITAGSLQSFVPEPSSCLLMAIGVAVLARRARKTRRS